MLIFGVFVTGGRGVGSSLGGIDTSVSDCDERDGAGFVLEADAQALDGDVGGLAATYPGGSGAARAVRIDTSINSLSIRSTQASKKIQTVAAVMPDIPPPSPTAASTPIRPQATPPAFQYDSAGGLSGLIGERG